jgi:hypothetical protein
VLAWLWLRLELNTTSLQGSQVLKSTKIYYLVFRSNLVSKGHLIFSKNVEEDTLQFSNALATLILGLQDYSTFVYGNDKFNIRHDSAGYFDSWKINAKPSQNASAVWCFH